MSGDLRPGEPGAADAQVAVADDDDFAVVADCEPPMYDEASDPHGGRLDGEAR